MLYGWYVHSRGTGSASPDVATTLAFIWQGTISSAGATGGTDLQYRTLYRGSDDHRRSRLAGVGGVAPAVTPDRSSR